jgi:phosphate transport system permease protein
MSPSRLFSFSSRILAIGALGVFAHILFDILWQGVPLIELKTFTEDPSSFGQEGGLRSIFVSTAFILMITLLTTFLLGCLTSYYLYLNTGQRSPLRTLLRILSGIPSIVYGLFGNILFCQYLGFGYSLLSGGLTLACMVLPYFVTVLEENLRQLPFEWKLQKRSLNLSDWSFFLFVLREPMKAPLIGAFVLSLTRAIAETAALLFTSGYVDRFPESLLDSGRFITVHIFDLVLNVSGAQKKAYLSSALLLVFIAGLSLLSEWLKQRYLVKGRSYV